MGAEQKDDSPRTGIVREYSTKRLLDRTIDPPMYLDEELPTTVILGSRARRFLAPGAGTVVTQQTSSGSIREFVPGTFGFRVTRVSIAFGTAGQRWGIWHSRIGTVDIQTPTGPGRSGASGNYGQVDMRGNAMSPVYVLPAGTISWAFSGSMSAKAMSAQIMEAIPIIRPPDQL